MVGSRTASKDQAKHKQAARWVRKEGSQKVQLSSHDGVRGGRKVIAYTKLTTLLGATWRWWREWPPDPNSQNHCWNRSGGQILELKHSQDRFSKTLTYTSTPLQLGREGRLKPSRSMTVKFPYQPVKTNRYERWGRQSVIRD